METFKNIPDYDRYAVSNIGRVINNKTGRILKPGFNKHGYLQVSLYKDGKAKSYLLHRLIALAFLENVDNKDLVDHINNIKHDNRLENLRWATMAENNQNAKLAITNTSGVKGVYFSKREQKWRVQISIDGKQKYFGFYTDIEDAKIARVKIALEVQGEFMNECEKYK